MQSVRCHSFVTVSQSFLQHNGTGAAVCLFFSKNRRLNNVRAGAGDGPADKT